MHGAVGELGRQAPATQRVLCYRIVVLGSILPNTFPGWASSAATMFTYLFRLSDSTVPLITTIFLIAIALAVTVSQVVYNTLERVELVLVAIIVVFRLIARS